MRCLVVISLDFLTNRGEGGGLLVGDGVDQVHPHLYLPQIHVLHHRLPLLFWICYSCSSSVQILEIEHEAKDHIGNHPPLTRGNLF